MGRVDPGTARRSGTCSRKRVALFFFFFKSVLAQTFSESMSCWRKLRLGGAEEEAEQEEKQKEKRVGWDERRKRRRSRLKKKKSKKRVGEYVKEEEE